MTATKSSCSSSVVLRRAKAIDTILPFDSNFRSGRQAADSVSGIYLLHVLAPNCRICLIRRPQSLPEAWHLAHAFCAGQHVANAASGNGQPTHPALALVLSLRHQLLVQLATACRTLVREQSPPVVPSCVHVKLFCCWIGDARSGRNGLHPAG